MPNDIADASICIRTRDGYEIRICLGRADSKSELSPEELASRNMRRIEEARAAGLLPPRRL